MKRYKNFIEAKQVGVLYHITSIKNLLAILKTNQLQGAINGISTTRNKYLYKTISTVGGNQCQLVLNGDKLSNKYKIKPYNDLTNISYGDENEELIYTRVINNVKKYIIKVQLLKPSNWWFKDKKDLMTINRLLGKDLEDDFDVNILIDFLKTHNIIIEVIK